MMMARGNRRDIMKRYGNREIFTNDDEMYEVTTQLKKWFNKNIY